MTTDDTDAVRKDLQILYETIARNRERDWSDYRDSHEFRLVADGVVRVAKSDSDSDDDGVYRVRVDGDGAVETYSELRISLVDLDTDAVGWHVGYWLAFGFGAEPDSEKPPPFRDASYEERRSAWWE